MMVAWGQVYKIKNIYNIFIPLFESMLNFLDDKVKMFTAFWLEIPV